MSELKQTVLNSVNDILVDLHVSIEVIGEIAKNLLVIVLLGALATMFVRSARAESLTDGVYVGANVSHVSVANSDHDEKVALGVVVGKDLLAGIKAEAEIGTTVYNRKTEKFGELDFSHLLATVSYDLPVALPFAAKPFVGVVGGVVKADRNALAGDRFSAAYGASAGVAVPVMENIDAVVSYRYLQTDSGVVTTKAGKTTDMSTHAIGVGVRYSF